MQFKNSSLTNPQRSRVFRLELLALLVIGALFFFAIDQHGSMKDYNDFLRTDSRDLVAGNAAPLSAEQRKAEIEEAVTAALAKALDKLTLLAAPVPASTPVTPETLPKTTATTTAVTPMRQDFFDMGRQTGTDKVKGSADMQRCLDNEETCSHPELDNERCRVFGHFYDTIYDRWLAPFTVENTPAQFLEIGYYNGQGFESFTNYFSSNPMAELHSMEISCIEKGAQKEGKWPWGNFAEKHPWYQRLLDEKRLHCGDANDYDFLQKTWTNLMKRPDAPPLKVVIDDGSHLHEHMATSLFFWLPRIAPGGILVVEDIQPTREADKFRTHIVPQVMKDMHWCGGDFTKDSSIPEDSRCFPTIQPFLHGVHCELHVCVFVRNDQPAIEPDRESSITPNHAWDDIPKCLFGPHKRN